MGEVLPFKRKLTMKPKQTVKPVPNIISLENELTELNIHLILHDDYGAKETKRKIAEVENRLEDLRSKERVKK